MKKYSANTVHSQIIVKGYKTLYNQSGIQLRAYQDKCTVIFDTSAQSFSTSETIWITNFVPTGYRPSNPVISTTTSNLSGYVYVLANGNLCRKGTSSFNASVWCEISWNY